MSPCYSNLVLFDPLKAAGERRHRHSRARRAMVVAGQLPQSRLLPAEEREVARRPALHLAATSKYTFDVVREAPDAAGQAPPQPAQGLVRQRGGHRGAGAAHRGVPAQAPAAVAPAHARLGLLAGLPGARAARPSCASSCVGTGPVPAQGVRSAASPCELERNPDYFIPDRPYLDGIRYTDHHRARHASAPRSRPAGSTPSCRSR